MTKQIRYTLEYKIKTVQLYLKSDLSANQLALNLGIHPHTVRHWIQDYNDGKLKMDISIANEKSSVPIKSANVHQDTSKRPDIEIIFSKISGLEFEIKELKAFLQKYLLEL